MILTLIKLCYYYILLRRRPLIRGLINVLYVRVYTQNDFRKFIKMPLYNHWYIGILRKYKHGPFDLKLIIYI